ncbi:MAG: hypothetical protein K0S41_3653 [Anaerocolumna sp.]|jgi:serine/threonine-protein kinase|nr:hypothetical protein [Anaerocolumna sp.]
MIIKDLTINKRYKTIEKIGVGGMGEVWKCSDILLERFVALKFVNEVHSSDDDSIKIFKDEARLGARLIGHPNTVTVLDFGKFSHLKSNSILYYIVMEYIEGICLDKWINKYY